MIRTTGKIKGTWDAYILPDGVWLALPLIPPSQNQYLRWHWSKRKRYLDQLSRDMSLLAISCRCPRFKSATVHITYFFPDKRHRDKDNYNGKFLLDALRRANILEDDRAELVNLPQPEFEIDRHYPRTEIWITAEDEQIPGANICTSREKTEQPMYLQEF